MTFVRGGTAPIFAAYSSMLCYFFFFGGARKEISLIHGVSFTNIPEVLHDYVFSFSFITSASSDHVNNVLQLDACQESDSRPL